MGEIADAPAYGMNAFEPEITQLMTQYEENPPQDAIKQAQAELAATKDVMVQSIDAVLSRGERIEILVDRTDDLSSQARAFRKRATVLRRKMWYRNAKTLVAVGFSGVVRPPFLLASLSLLPSLTFSVLCLQLLLYLLVASACGAGLNHCRA